MNIVNEIIRDSRPIEEVGQIAQKDFKDRYLDGQKPLVIRGYANEWEALKKWDLEYFASLEGQSTVNVLNGEYVQGAQKFKSGDFQAFIRLLQEEENSDQKTYLAAIDLHHLHNVVVFFWQVVQHEDDYVLICHCHAQYLQSLFQM